MAEYIVSRQRIVRRYKDSDTGRMVIDETQWNLVTFNEAGQMLEPRDTLRELSSYDERTNKPCDGFVFLDKNDRLGNLNPLLPINTLRT